MQSAARVTARVSARLDVAPPRARALVDSSSSIALESPGGVLAICRPASRTSPIAVTVASARALAHGSALSSVGIDEPTRARSPANTSASSPNARGRAGEAAGSRALAPEPTLESAAVRSSAGLRPAETPSVSRCMASAGHRAQFGPILCLTRTVADASPPTPAVVPHVCETRASVKLLAVSATARASTSCAVKPDAALARSTLLPRAPECSPATPSTLSTARASSQIDSPLPTRMRASAPLSAAASAPVDCVAEVTVGGARCSALPVTARLDTLTRTSSRARVDPGPHESTAALHSLLETPTPDAPPARPQTYSSTLVAVGGSARIEPTAYVVQAPSGRSRTRSCSSITTDDPVPTLRSSALPTSRAHLLPPNEPRGHLVARALSRCSLRLDAYAAKNPLLYNACIVSVGSATTVKLHGLKLYRAVSRAAAVAQAVDRIVPVDPLLTTARGSTTPPSEATSAAHHDRSWAMFKVAYAAAGETAVYDIERLAARVARDYLEQTVAPMRALLDELRARAVNLPGIERLVAPAPPPRAKSAAVQAQADAKRADRKKRRNQTRTQAPHKLIGRRYVVGSARVTVTGYDPQSGRFECTTEDGDVVSYSLAELSG